MPKESVNQPSQRVSPEAKNGRASVSRRTSSGSHAGIRAKTAPVARVTGFEGTMGGRAPCVGVHDEAPGMMEATAPDSTNPTRWVPKSNAGSFEPQRSLDQGRALAEPHGEIITERRQDAHPDVGVRTGDKRVLGDVRDRLGPAGARLSRGPDRGGGRRKAQDARGRVKRDPRLRQGIGPEPGKVPDRRCLRVRGVIGLDPGVLEPRQVGEAGVRSLACGDELGEIRAIGDHHRRARLPGANEGARDRAEHLVPRHPARRRIAGLEGADEADGDVVAVDREAARVRRGEASARHGRRGRGGLAERGREGVDRRVKRHRRAPRSWRSRPS